jgi:RNA polymerase sigma-70 factor, ECF subfamily
MSVSAQRAAREPEPDTQKVWQEFHDGLLSFVRRRVSSPETAEDIVQDVMVRVQRQSERLERAESIGAWVYAIARNAITDHYRRASTRREVASGSEVDPGIADESEAGARDVRAELAACCIAPFLERLPETYREALKLTEIDGITQAEAARRLGLSPSGMKSRVQRGRRRLKDALVQCCDVDLDARGGVTDYRVREGSGGGCRTG